MAFVDVSGEITRTFFDGKGAEVTEKWQQQGQERSKKWAAFFEQPHGLNVGDRVKVSGQHSDKVESFTNRDGETVTVVKRTINKSRVKTDDRAPVETTDERDDWSQESFADPTPF